MYCILRKECCTTIKISECGNGKVTEDWVKSGREKNGCGMKTENHEEDMIREGVM